MTTRPRTEPDTPSTAVPPTESFRHPDAIAPTVLVTEPQRPREPGLVQLAPEAEAPPSRDTDPSPPPSRKRAGEAPAAPTTMDARALASVTTKSPATSLEDERDVGSSRRAGYVISSQRVNQTEYRLDELAEQLRALDARLRLSHKAQQRQTRLLMALALFSAVAWLLCWAR